jgi:hypothetical protein
MNVQPEPDIQNLDIQRDVLPLFAIQPGESQPKDFLGTGFLITTGILVTCWHCVRDVLSAGHAVAAAVKTPSGGGYALNVVAELEQDSNETDLAIGTVEQLATVGLTLAESQLAIGTDVWSYGYPLTRPPDERRPEWLLEGRFLQGYVTRLFYYSEARIPSYELDMKAPAGLSGAPLVEVGSRRVAGVVYGVNEVALIEQFGRVDPETRVREPEIQRVEAFALAHNTPTIRRLSGAATGGRPLADYLRAQDAQASEALRAITNPPTTDPG